MSNRIRIIIIAVVLVILTAVYFVYDPSSPGPVRFPRCPFLVLTGLKCPGCGSQRALHALLSFNWSDVVKYNAMFVLVIPYLILFGIGLWKKDEYPEFHNILNSYFSCILIGMIIIGWWILRNVFDW